MKQNSLLEQYTALVEAEKNLAGLAAEFGAGAALRTALPVKIFTPGGHPVAACEIPLVVLLADVRRGLTAYAYLRKILGADVFDALVKETAGEGDQKEPRPTRAADALVTALDTGRAYVDRLRAAGFANEDE